MEGMCGMCLASGATKGVQGIISGTTHGVSSIASTTKNVVGKFGRRQTGANRLSVDISDVSRGMELLGGIEEKGVSHIRG